MVSENVIQQNLQPQKIVDRVLQEIDKGEIPLNIYLYISKAFDTLDHSILIAKLKYYSIKHKEIELFKSYLTNHKQFVDIDGTS